MEIESFNKIFFISLHVSIIFLHNRANLLKTNDLWNEEYSDLDIMTIKWVGVLILFFEFNKLRIRELQARLSPFIKRVSAIF